MAGIVPGTTTYEDVLKIGGSEPEEHEQLATPDRRTVFYRGSRIVPQRRRRFGWLATVSGWSVEQHEVEITLDRNVVADIQARVRCAPLASAADRALTAIANRPHIDSHRIFIPHASPREACIWQS